MNLTHEFYDMNSDPLNLGDTVEIKSHKYDGLYHRPVIGDIKEISVHGLSLILPNGENKWIAFTFTGTSTDRVYKMIGEEPQDGRYPWNKRGYIKLIK